MFGGKEGGNGESDGLLQNDWPGRQAGPSAGPSSCWSEDSSAKVFFHFIFALANNNQVITDGYQEHLETLHQKMNQMLCKR